MEHIFKKVLSVAALLSMVALQANESTPTLVLRSQGFHAERQKDSGQVGHTHLYDMESWYGTLDVAIGYYRSTRGGTLAKCLFGPDASCNDCEATILVQGSAVPVRAERAWLADYLYLNCAFDGSFSVKPQIQNVVVDLDFYLGLDEWVNGMYFRLYGPINWTKWQTNFCATGEGLTTSCSAGYFTPGGHEVLLTTLGQYFAGEAPATVDGVTFRGLRFAKMGSCCNQTKTGFADLRAELGWNFLHDEDYHLGLFIAAAAPTGNQRDATFVMEPVVGNGHHWELGGGLTAHYVFWRSSDEEKHFGFYLDATITHLFNAKETRTFDLVDRNDSRYMLASQFTKVITGSLGGNTAAFTTGTTGFTAAQGQFNSLYTPVANLTTADFNVSIGAQADIVAMFNFTSCGFSWDLGYDFWGRSCEKFSCTADCSCNPENLFNTTQRNTWALKGDARMFGFPATSAGGLTTSDFVALSATENNADIHKGTNAAAVTTTCLAKQNCGIDKAQFAVAGTSAAVVLLHTPLSLGGLNTATNQIKTSIQPIYLSQADVAQQGTRGISNSLFTHISYTWDRDNWIPYLGIGGSYEWGTNHGCCDTTSSNCSTGSCATSACSTGCSSNDCSECEKCALSQWGVWVKGGLSFN